MRKPAFCICENKDADQLRGVTSLHRWYNPSTSYIRNSKPLANLCSCTVWFVLDLVENPEDRFSHNEAQMISDKNARHYFIFHDAKMHATYRILEH